MATIREQLFSTAIREWAYDDRARELTVNFTDGSMYLFVGIGPGTWQSLKSAPSPGGALNQLVLRLQKGRRLV